MPDPAVEDVLHLEPTGRKRGSRRGLAHGDGAVDAGAVEGSPLQRFVEAAISQAPEPAGGEANADAAAAPSSGGGDADAAAGLAEAADVASLGGSSADLIAVNSGKGAVCVQVHSSVVLHSLAHGLTAADLRMWLPATCGQVRVLQRLFTLPQGPLYVAPATHSKLRLFRRQGQPPATGAASAAAGALPQPEEQEIRLPSHQFLWLTSNLRVATVGIHHGLIDAQSDGDTKLMIIDMHARDRSTAAVVQQAAACSSGGVNADLALDDLSPDGSAPECSSEELGGLVTDVVVTQPAYVVLWLEPLELPRYLVAADALRGIHRTPERRASAAAFLPAGAAEANPDVEYSSRVGPVFVTPFVQGVVGSSWVHDVNPAAFLHRAASHHNFTPVGEPDGDQEAASDLETADGAESPVIAFIPEQQRHAQASAAHDTHRLQAEGGSSFSWLGMSSSTAPSSAAMPLSARARARAAAVRIHMDALTLRVSPQPQPVPSVGNGAADGKTPDRSSVRHALDGASGSELLELQEAIPHGVAQQASVTCSDFDLAACEAVPERPLALIEGREYRLRAELVGASGHRLTLGTNVRFNLDYTCGGTAPSQDVGAGAAPVDASGLSVLHADPFPRPGENVPLSHRYGTHGHPQGHSEQAWGERPPLEPWARTLQCGEGMRAMDTSVTGNVTWERVAGVRIRALQAAVNDASDARSAGTEQRVATLLLLDGHLQPVVSQAASEGPDSHARTPAMSDLTVGGASPAGHVEFSLGRITHPTSKMTWRPEGGQPLRVAADLSIVPPLQLVWPQPRATYSTLALSRCTTPELPHIRVAALDTVGANSGVTSFPLVVAGGTQGHLQAAPRAPAFPNATHDEGEEPHHVDHSALVYSVHMMSGPGADAGAVLQVTSDGEVSLMGSGMEALVLAVDAQLPENGIAAVVSVSRPGEIFFRAQDVHFVRDEMAVIPLYARDRSGNQYDVCFNLGSELTWMVDTGLPGHPPHAQSKDAAAALPVTVLFHSGWGRGGHRIISALHLEQSHGYLSAATAVALAEVPADACGVVVLRADAVGAVTLTVRHQDLLATVQVRVYEHLQIAFPARFITTAQLEAAIGTRPRQSGLTGSEANSWATRMQQRGSVTVVAPRAPKVALSSRIHPRVGLLEGEHVSQASAVHPVVIAVGSSVALLAVGGAQSFSRTRECEEHALRHGIELSEQCATAALAGVQHNLCIIHPLAANLSSSQPTAPFTSTSGRVHVCFSDSDLATALVREGLAAELGLVVAAEEVFVTTFRERAPIAPLEQDAVSAASSYSNPSMSGQAGSGGLLSPERVLSVPGFRYRVHCSSATNGAPITLALHSWRIGPAGRALEDAATQAIRPSAERHAEQVVELSVVCDVPISAEVAVQRESTSAFADTHLGTTSAHRMRMCRYEATNQSMQGGLGMFCAASDSASPAIPGARPVSRPTGLLSTDAFVLGVRFYGGLLPTVPIINVTGHSFAQDPNWSLTADAMQQNGSSAQTASYSLQASVPRTSLGNGTPPPLQPVELQLRNQHAYQYDAKHAAPYGKATISTAAFLQAALPLLALSEAGSVASDLLAVRARAPPGQQGVVYTSASRSSGLDALHTPGHSSPILHEKERTPEALHAAASRLHPRQTHLYWERHVLAGWLLTGGKAVGVMGGTAAQLAWAPASGAPGPPSSPRSLSVHLQVVPPVQTLPARLVLTNTVDSVGWAMLTGGCASSVIAEPEGGLLTVTKLYKDVHHGDGGSNTTALHVFAVQPRRALAAPFGVDWIADEGAVAAQAPVLAREGRDRLVLTDPCVGVPSSHVEVDVTRPATVQAISSSPFLPLGGSSALAVTVTSVTGNAFPSGQLRFMRPRVEVMVRHSASGVYNASATTTPVVEVDEQWVPCSDEHASIVGSTLFQHPAWHRAIPVLQAQSLRCLQPHYTIRAVGVGEAHVRVSVQSCVLQKYGSTIDHTVDSVDSGLHAAGQAKQLEEVRCSDIWSDPFTLTVQAPIRAVPEEVTLFPDSSFRLHIVAERSFAESAAHNKRASALRIRGRAALGSVPTVALRFPDARHFQRMAGLLRFESSNPSVATVTADGLVTAVGSLGEAVITIRLRSMVDADRGGCPTMDPLQATLGMREGAGGACSPDLTSIAAFTGARVSVRVALPSAVHITANPSAPMDAASLLRAIRHTTEQPHTTRYSSSNSEHAAAASGEKQLVDGPQWLPLVPVIAGGSRKVYVVTAEGHTALSGAGFAGVGSTDVEVTWALGSQAESHGTDAAAPATYSQHDDDPHKRDELADYMLPWESAHRNSFALQLHRSRDGEPVRRANASSTGLRQRTFGHGVWVMADQSPAVDAVSAPAHGRSAGAYPVHCRICALVRIRTRKYGTHHLRACAVVASLPELQLLQPTPVSVHPLSFTETAGDKSSADDAGAAGASLIESPGISRGRFVPSMLLVPPFARSLIATSVDRATEWLPPGLMHTVRATVVSVRKPAHQPGFRGGEGGTTAFVEATVTHDVEGILNRAEGDTAPGTAHGTAVVSVDAKGRQWLATGACGSLSQRRPGSSGGLSSSSHDSTTEHSLEAHTSHARHLAFLAVEESVGFDNEVLKELRPEDVAELRRLVSWYPTQSMTLRIVCEPIQQVMLEPVPAFLPEPLPSATARPAGDESGAVVDSDTAVTVAAGASAILRALPADSWGRAFSTGIGALCPFSTRHIADQQTDTHSSDNDVLPPACSAAHLGWTLYSSDHYRVMPSFAFRWDLLEESGVYSHGSLLTATPHVSSAAAIAASARTDELFVVLHGVTEGRAVVQLYHESPEEAEAAGRRADAATAAARLSVGPAVRGDAVEVAVQTMIHPSGNVTVAMGGILRFTLSGAFSASAASPSDSLSFEEMLDAPLMPVSALQSCIAVLSGGTRSAASFPPAISRSRGSANWSSSNPAVLWVHPETGCTIAVGAGDAVVRAETLSPLPRSASTAPDMRPGAFAFVRVVAPEAVEHRLRLLSLDELAAGAAAAGVGSLEARGPADAGVHDGGGPRLPTVSDPDLVPSAAATAFLHELQKAGDSVALSPVPAVFRVESTARVAGRVIPLQEGPHVTQNLQFVCEVSPPAAGGPVQVFAVGPGAQLAARDLSVWPRHNRQHEHVHAGSDGPAAELRQAARAAWGNFAETELGGGDTAEGLGGVGTDVAASLARAASRLVGDGRRIRELAEAVQEYLLRLVPHDRFCVAASSTFLRQVRPRGVRLPFSTVLEVPAAAGAPRNETASAGEESARSSLRVNARVFGLAPCTACKAAPAAPLELHESVTGLTTGYLRAPQLVPASVLLQSLPVGSKASNVAGGVYGPPLCGIEGSTGDRLAPEHTVISRRPNPELVAGIVTFPHRQASEASLALPEELETDACQREREGISLRQQWLPSKRTHGIVAGPTLIKRPESWLVLTAEAPSWAALLFERAGPAAANHTSSAQLATRFELQVDPRLQAALLPAAAVGDATVSTMPAGFAMSEEDAKDLRALVQASCKAGACPTAVFLATVRRRERPHSHTPAPTPFPLPAGANASGEHSVGQMRAGHSSSSMATEVASWRADTPSFVNADVQLRCLSTGHSMALAFAFDNGSGLPEPAVAVAGGAAAASGAHAGAASLAGGRHPGEEEVLAPVVRILFGGVLAWLLPALVGFVVASALCPGRLKHWPSRGLLASPRFEEGGPTPAIRRTVSALPKGGGRRRRSATLDDTRIHHSVSASEVEGGPGRAAGRGMGHGDLGSSAVSSTLSARPAAPPLVADLSGRPVAAAAELARGIPSHTRRWQTMPGDLHTSQLFSNAQPDAASGSAPRVDTARIEPLERQTSSTMSSPSARSSPTASEVGQMSASGW